MYSEVEHKLQEFHYVEDFLINKYEKAFYILSSRGLSYKYYGSENIQERVVVRNSRIKGFTVDLSMNYIFYFTRYQIYVINVNRLLTRLIYLSEYPIYDLDINNIYSLIIISCYKMINGSKLPYIKHLKPNGEEIEERIFTLERNFVFVDHYTNEPRSASKIFIDIIDTRSDEESNSALVITKHGFFDLLSFCLLKNIRRTYITRENNEVIQHGCKYSTCDQFCFPLSEYHYQCGCIEGMEYNKHMAKCICAANNTVCLNCQVSEFYCSNERCISTMLKCDGHDDCGDNSDETTCEQAYPLCSEEEFECFTIECISREQVCNGHLDCKDGSDEDECEVIKCRPREFECDDGSCINLNQTCDGIFNCKDFSDERSCNMRCLDKYIDNMSCLLICDKECIPYYKICDHVTDCKSNIDELGCDHDKSCDNENYTSCPNSVRCYHNAQICDGFNDCNDIRDESNCMLRNCHMNGLFQCIQDKNCIHLDKVCDTIYDCQDESDETEFCERELVDDNIIITSLHDGAVMIEIIKYSGNKYNILIINSDNRAEIFNKIDNYTKSLIVRNHIVCHRYVLNITNIGTGKFRNQHYIYDFYELSAPKNLNYNVEKNLITWAGSIPDCLSRVFYIECLNEDGILVRNFSSWEYYIIKFTPNTTCKVSTCFDTTFNISCSPFAEIKLKKILPATFNTGRIVLIMVIIALTGLISLCYCMKQKFPLVFMKIYGFSKEKSTVVTYIISERQLDYHKVAVSTDKQ